MTMTIKGGDRLKSDKIKVLHIHQDHHSIAICFSFLNYPDQFFVCLIEKTPIGLVLNYVRHDELMPHEFCCKCHSTFDSSFRPCHYFNNHLNDFLSLLKETEELRFLLLY